MSHRILVIASMGVHLRVSHHQLLVNDADGISSSVPLDEILCVIIDSPGVTITSSLLTEMMENKVVCIITNTCHLPAGVLLPLSGHTLSTKRLRLQIEISAPIKKRIWKYIVVEKIKGQARVLKALHGSDEGLMAMSKKVNSGDATNVEAHAAKRYWNALFETTSFRRGRANPDQNMMLNYGYSIIRSVLARQIVACGLHPSLGIHHHNQYNTFCLADDLIEPFRPFVDLTVAEWIQQYGVPNELNKACKEHLISVLTKDITIDKTNCSCLRATELIAQCLVKVFEKERSTFSTLSW